VNTLQGSQAKNFCARRCLMAVLVLVLALGAAVAPFGGVAAADKKDAGTGNRIIISGASGGLAGETIDALLAHGAKPSDLILVTRTPEKLSALAARGATVRAGDFNKPDALPAAFEGGRSMLLISTSGGGDRVEQHTAAISAARKAGVRHIVYTSFINAVDDNPAMVTRDHRLTEEALRKGGVPFTILRNQLYSDGLVAHGAQAVATGEIVTNSGRGKWAPVARKDCAAAAAVVLTSPGHEGKTYDITGPDLINDDDLARMLTSITGKPVRVTQVDDAAYIARAVQAGAPEAGAKMGASFGIATRNNYLNIKSETLQILLGRPPQSVRELLTENKALLLAPARR